jgi:hypothetical protein
VGVCVLEKMTQMEDVPVKVVWNNPSPEQQHVKNPFTVFTSTCTELSKHKTQSLSTNIVSPGCSFCRSRNNKTSRYLSYEKVTMMVMLQQKSTVASHNFQLVRRTFCTTVPIAIRNAHSPLDNVWTMKSTPEQQNPATELAGLNPAPTSVVASPNP